MLTVRYPNGTVVTYNDATDHSLDPHGGIHIVQRKDKQDYWIAYIQPSAMATVEYVRACKVETPEKATLENGLRFVLEHLKQFDGWNNVSQLKKLKRLLSKFNTRTGAWKE